MNTACYNNTAALSLFPKIVTTIFTTRYYFCLQQCPGQPAHVCAEALGRRPDADRMLEHVLCKPLCLLDYTISAAAYTMHYCKLHSQIKAHSTSCQQVSPPTRPKVFSLDRVELPAIRYFLIISKECPSTNNLLHKYSSAHLNVLWMCVGVL